MFNNPGVTALFILIKNIMDYFVEERTRSSHDSALFLSKCLLDEDSVNTTVRLTESVAIKICASTLPYASFYKHQKFCPAVMANHVVPPSRVTIVIISVLLPVVVKVGALPPDHLNDAGQFTVFDPAES